MIDLARTHSEYPLLAAVVVALVLLVLGLCGFGVLILDLTGHIEPGTTLAEKMDNGSAGLNVMLNAASLIVAIGASASLGLFLSRWLRRPRSGRGDHG